MREAEELWSACTGALRATLQEAAWTTHFGDTRGLERTPDRLVVSVPSSLIKERIESRFFSHVTRALMDVGAGEVELVLEVHPAAGERLEGHRVPVPASQRWATSEVEAAPTDLKPLFNGKYTFDAFVTGTSNRFACAAAQAVAETPARSYNPLFISGGSGLGKTHLLHAIGKQVQENYPHHSVLYVSTEAFMNDFVEAIRTNSRMPFKRRYREIDVLLVDDIQFMENKEGLQEEFFHTFNDLQQSDSQIVLTSDRPPKNIKTLEERLRSRFEMGLITDIQPPDLETRIAILRRKAERETVPVPEAVHAFIATHVINNIRELEGALTRVTAFASLNGTQLTEELAERALADLLHDVRPLTITASMVLDAASVLFGIPIEDIVGHRRHRGLVQARQTSMYVCRELTDLSYPAIAREYGNRDHTTVMHAVDKIARQMGEDRSVYDLVATLTAQVKEHR